MDNNGHIHKYKRILRNGRKTSEFACTHPHCSYSRQGDYLVGKAAICPYCEQEFVVDRFAVNKHGLLHCDKCKRRPKKAGEGILETALEKIFEGGAS